MMLLVISEFATAPFSISLYMRKTWFSFHQCNQWWTWESSKNKIDIVIRQWTFGENCMVSSVPGQCEEHWTRTVSSVVKSGQGQLVNKRQGRWMNNGQGRWVNNGQGRWVNNGRVQRVNNGQWQCGEQWTRAVWRTVDKCSAVKSGQGQWVNTGQGQWVNIGQGQ